MALAVGRIPQQFISRPHAIDQPAGHYRRLFFQGLILATPSATHHDLQRALSQQNATPRIGRGFQGQRFFQWSKSDTLD
jgi:hypothetical protein